MNNNEPSIQLQGVHRAYHKKPVLNNLNLSIPEGQIYGFLGRNGSGKTTTMKLLAGLIKPNDGTVRVLGADPFTMSSAHRVHLGYMADGLPVGGAMRVGKLVDFCQRLYPLWDAELVRTMLSKYRIATNQWLATLSQGNQRLLFFTLAIAPHPKVLLLDEPAASLDVVARRQILDEILKLSQEFGSTIFFSTHMLSDVERVADHIGILSEGRLKISDSLDTLKETIRSVRFHSFTSGMPAESQIPVPAHRISYSDKELSLTLQIKNPEMVSDLAKAWKCKYEEYSLNLEDIFVELTNSNT